VTLLSIMRDVRSLRGGSQPHLMQASDGNYYIVKFQDNPQGTKVLANELLASRIAECIGLPVPRAVVVYLPEEVAAGLTFEKPGGKFPVAPGLHCGLKVVISPLKGRMYEIPPHREAHNTRNNTDLIGARLFDFWTRNHDLRQCIYWRRCAERKLSICFIDNGHCFGGPEWSISSHHVPLQLPEGTDIELLSGWIGRFERLTRAQLFALASEIPPEWYGNNQRSLNAMIEALLAQPSLSHAAQRALQTVTPFDFKIGSTCPSDSERIENGSQFGIDGFLWRAQAVTKHCPVAW
jgi:HipA-like kinase